MKWLINGVLMAAIVGLLFLLVQVHDKRLDVERQLASLQNRISDLDTENGRLEEDIEYYSMQENLEKEARARLNVKKPDEHLVILTPGEKTEKATTSLDSEKDSESFLKSIKNLFKRD